MQSWGRNGTRKRRRSCCAASRCGRSRWLVAAKSLEASHMLVLKRGVARLAVAAFPGLGDCGLGVVTTWQPCPHHRQTTTLSSQAHRFYGQWSHGTALSKGGHTPLSEKDDKEPTSSFTRSTVLSSPCTCLTLLTERHGCSVPLLLVRTSNPFLSYIEALPAWLYRSLTRHTAKGHGRYCTCLHADS
jgi:hypothetical protein